LPEGSRIQLLAPVVRGKKGQHREIFTMLRREGFTRVRVDGEFQELRSVVTPDKNKKHEIEVVIDRILIEKQKVKRRLADSVELCLKMGDGILILLVDEKERLFSQNYACARCGISFGELQPRLFSFNSPYGACESCDGLGTRLELDADLIVRDKTLSLKGGAIEAYRKMGKRMTIRYSRRLRQYCEWFHVKYTSSYAKIDAEKKRILLHGTSSKEEKKYGSYFEGVIPSLMHRFKTTESEFVKKRLMGYMGELPCGACEGRRLRPESLAVLIGGKNIDEVCHLTLEDALLFFKDLRLNAEERQIARLVLKEIRSRLQFLNDVGLGYLSLDRRSSTLAGGEAQRIRLGSQVGSGLVGVCYVLDEPTIGLHERDNKRLLGTLMQLRDLGNTVVVVEHDEDTIRQADHVIDIGPGAGHYGGELIARGKVEEILQVEASLTGQYLSGAAKIEVPSQRRKVTSGHAIEVKGARENNLKKVSVRFPLGVFSCVTGVSGSGKSTLVNEILYRGLNRVLHGGKEKPGAHDKITGTANLEKVIVIDQSPIGRTPRSNPLTYTGAFDEIRKLFSITKESKARGYSPGRFSFNLKEGRCQACDGQGVKVIEMHFLPDVHVMCETCKGRRYNRETLEIKYKGKDIAEVLAMSIEEALIFFANFPKIHKILTT
ncbi:MAG: excinuclease ABC subunit UvrA, partial [Planctomycetota bacterium]|nr:excinuclease ABC subunit UvrA [Planctomycetota bacterium]